MTDFQPPSTILTNVSGATQKDPFISSAAPIPAATSTPIVAKIVGINGAMMKKRNITSATRIPKMIKTTFTTKSTAFNIP